jgi:hypothetical protein
VRRWLIAGLTMLLVGCGGTTTPGGPTLVPEDHVQATSIVLTPDSLLTSGPPRNPVNPASMAEIDVASVMLTADDVPVGVVLRNQARIPAYYDLFEIPEAANDLTQSFHTPDDAAPIKLQMFAIVWLYPDAGVLTQAYTQLVKKTEATQSADGDPGEQSRQIDERNANYHDTQLMFVRCQALVFIQATAIKTLDPTLVPAWAQKIDQRIQASAICP